MGGQPANGHGQVLMLVATISLDARELFVDGCMSHVVMSSNQWLSCKDTFEVVKHDL